MRWVKKSELRDSVRKFSTWMTLVEICGGYNMILLKEIEMHHSRVYDVHLI